MSRFRFAVPLIVLAVLSQLVVSTRGAFSDGTATPASAFAASPDWVAPAASASRIARTTGTTPATLAPGVPYYVYANVSDTGNPASGTQTVTADVSALTAGATSIPLIPGSYTVGATTYNRRSAAVTTDDTVTAGTKAYTLQLGDLAGNSRTQGGFGVDATAAANFRDATEVANAGTAAAISVPTPAAVAGDTMFATVVTSANPAAIAPPAGWALYEQQGVAGLQLYIFRRTATGSEPPAYVFNADSAGRMVAGIVAYRDVVAGNAFTSLGESNPVATHTTGSLAVPAGTRLLSIFADATGGPHGWSAADTERVDVTSNTGSGEISLAIYNSAVLAAGTYQRSATSAFAVKNAVMILIALEG